MEDEKNLGLTCDNGDKDGLSSGGASITRCDGLDLMEVSVLEIILRFAVENIRDVPSLIRVNKTWNAAVKAVYPRVIMEAERLSRKEKAIPAEVMTNMLEKVFVELKNRNSTLYSKQQSKLVTPIPKWPSMEPRYHVALKTLTFDFYSRRDSRRDDFPYFYARLTNHLTILAQEKCQAISKALIAFSELSQGSAVFAHSTVVRETLKDLIQQWNAWEGISKHLLRITNYTFMYYLCHEYGLALLPENVARERFASALLESVQDDHDPAVAQGILQLLGQVETLAEMRQQDTTDQLLLHFLQASEKMSTTLPWSDVLRGCAICTPLAIRDRFYATRDVLQALLTN